MYSNNFVHAQAVRALPLGTFDVPLFCRLYRDTARSGLGTLPSPSHLPYTAFPKKFYSPRKLVLYTAHALTHTVKSDWGELFAEALLLIIIIVLLMLKCGMQMILE